MDDSTPNADAPKPPWRFRRTRIAVSVFFGVLTVLLVLLWVRSYWRMDALHRTGKSFIAVYSNDGYLALIYLPIANLERQKDPGSGYASMPATDFVPAPVEFSQYEMRVALPHQLIVLLAAAVAALPWVTLRFSIRTMLIATTMVAVLLGLAVWAAG